MNRILALALLLAAGSARGQVHFSQPSVDRGEVLTGVRLVQTFPFENRGREPIALRGVRTTCGCLTPRVTRHFFLPGESGEVVLEVNTLSQPEGANAWRLELEYLDGERSRRQTLELRAQLRTEIEVTPASLTLYTDGTVGGIVTLRDRRSTPTLRLTECRTTSSWLQTRLRADDGLTVELSLAPGYPEGRHEETLSLYTSDPAYAELRVPVTVVKRAKQGVMCTPAAVTLTALAGQESTSRVVLVRAGDEGEVAVQDVRADHPAIRCRWAAGPGKMATVKVLADPALAPMGVQGTVEIQVSRPAPQTLRLPVTLTVQ